MIDGRRFSVPEVIQTSTMDCGPAALAALLAGFDIPANYGHLREICQTDVDGTAIGTLEEVARRYGLEADEIMLPVDHLAEPAADALPAIAALRLPNGSPHFVVLWRRVGRLVQVMDPAHGRSWVTLEALERRLYLHRQEVDAADFHAWFASEENLVVQRARLRRLGVPSGAAKALTEAALAPGDWEPCARLDGAVRLVAHLRRAGAVPRRATGGLVAALAAAGEVSDRHLAMVAGAPGMVFLRGVVLVRVRRPVLAGAGAAPDVGAGPAEATTVRPPAASTTSGPGRLLVGLLRREPLVAAVALVLLLVLAGGTLVFEGLVLRGLLGLVDELDAGRARAVAVAVALVLLAALAALDVSVRTLVAGAGRRLELRLRLAFLERLPSLKDRYFRTRLASDLAQRGHAVHALRAIPEVAGGLVRSWVELVLLAAALVWIAPAGAPLIGAALVAALVGPLIAQGILRDLDLRARTHAGGLGRFFLDTLLGAEVIRAHGAGAALSRAHEALLVEWLAARRRSVAVEVAVEAGLFVAVAAPLVALVVRELSRGAVDGAALLLVYWAMSMPQRALLAAQQLATVPALRNTTARLVEPLASDAPEPDERAEVVEPTAVEPTPTARPAAGVAIELAGVEVSAGGTEILHGVDLSIPAGGHVAIIGPSGAGKSTLVSLLLGLQEPSAGSLTVDGHPLGPATLEALRRRTAWIDPAVHLWSATLLENLLYGAAADGLEHVPAAIDAAALREVVEAVPDGLQTTIGEAGRLLSGGQGQRVRVGRALLRADAALVLLDEPFRGLEQAARRRLLGAVRRRWADATLIYVTHDVAHALEFDRVLVVADGRVAEDGAPAALAADPASRLAALLAAADDVSRRMWGDPRWRRIHLEDRAVRDEVRVDG